MNSEKFTDLVVYSDLLKDHLFPLEFDSHWEYMERIVGEQIRANDLNEYQLEIVNNLLTVATCKSLSAGYSGSPNDGGASRFVYEAVGFLMARIAGSERYTDLARKVKLCKDSDFEDLS
jgi:hypothetical protein